jgi:cation diffusion facilitator family transporter
MEIEKWGWYSIAVNVLLAGIDLSVALYSGSLAVKAEILHNVVDLLTAVAVLVGLKIAGRKTRKFPYGLYKVENIIALAMSMLIFFTAYEVGRRAVFAPEFEVTVAPWCFAALALAGGIAVVFSFLELRAGRQSGSPALIADAREYRVHILTTAVILVALAGHNINLPLDRIAAVVVLIAIAKTGWELLVSGVSVLLDASLDPAAIDKVRQLILSQPQVVEVHWITGRNAGRVRFVEAEVSLRISNLEKAEKITATIENKVKNALENIERVVIHAEPRPKTHILCALPLNDASGEISRHFGQAPFFAIVTLRIKDKAVENRDIEPNPYADTEKGKGIKVAEWLVDRRIDRIFLMEPFQGRGPEYVFRNAGVEVNTVNKATLSEVIDEIL